MKTNNRFLQFIQRFSARTYWIIGLLDSRPRGDALAPSRAKANKLIWLSSSFVGTILLRLLPPAPLRVVSTVPPELLALDEGTAEQPASTELVDRLRDKARELRDTERELEDAERNVENIKGRINKLKGETIPSLMTQAKTDHIGLPAERNHPAYDCKLKPWYAGSIDKENPEPAYDWLEANDHGDIVKHAFTVTFGKGDHKSAAKFRERLTKAGYEFKEERGVHYMTLQAWIKEQIEEYEAPPPTDLFNLQIGQRADLKERKEKVTKKREVAKNDKVY